MRPAASPALLFLHAVAGQFIFGLVLALPGTLFGMPSWTSAVHCDVAAQANLLASFFVGQLVCTAAAGTLVDHHGSGRVMVAGSAGLVAGFLVLAKAVSPATAAAGIVLLAAGGSAINAGSNTLVSVTFGERRGAMLSLMSVFSAIGACLAPVALQSGDLDVVQRLNVLAAASAIVTVVPLAVADVPWTSSGVSLRAMLSLGRDRALLALTALVAVDFGVEAVMAGWSAAYTLAVLPAASGGAAVAAYWGGIAAGRTVAPLILRRRSKPTTIALGALAAAMGIGLVAGATSPGWLFAGAAIAGAAIGPIAPTLISAAGDRYPRRTGLAIGAVIALGQIGGVTLPWITGRTAIAVGFRGAMLVPIAAALVIAVGAVWLRMRRGR